MKKRNKVLWIIFGAGAVGLALTIGIGLWAGMIGSKDDTKVYGIDQPFEAVQLDTHKAQVSYEAAEGQSSLEASVNVWLSGEMQMDELVEIEVQNGVLIVTETPFAPEFFGVFPQPYELNLTLRAPQSVIDEMEEGQ